MNKQHNNFLKKKQTHRHIHIQMTKQMNGGGVLFPASFADVPLRSFYGYNDSSNDPNTLQIAGRQTGNFIGGSARRRRSKKTMKKRTNKKRSTHRRKFRRTASSGIRLGGAGSLQDWMRPAGQIDRMYSANRLPLE